MMEVQEFRSASGKRISALPQEVFPNFWGYAYKLDRRGIAF
jgi:hypothetical protein